MDIFKFYAMLSIIALSLTLGGQCLYENKDHSKEIYCEYAYSVHTLGGEFLGYSHYSTPDSNRCITISKKTYCSDMIIKQTPKNTEMCNKGKK